MLDRILRDRRSTPLGMIARLLFIDVTAVDDGLSHRVSQQIYDEALAAGIGRYIAQCGKLVLPAPMITQPGKPCSLCVSLPCDPTASDRRRSPRPFHAGQT